MRLVTSLTAACVLITLLILVGCIDNGAKTAIIRGVVMDSATSTALTGVTVKVGSVSAVTNLNGQYSLSIASGSNIIVRAKMTGYVDVIDVVSVSNGGAAEVNFTLKAVGLVHVMTDMLTSEKTVTDARGTVIILPDSSIVNSDGVLVDTAEIQVTTSIANDPNYVDNFPGLFIGNQGGVNKSIESFGFVTVNLNSGGKVCNLGPGKTATIDIPVGGGDADPGTQDIDLWSLDETIGKWVWEGTAHRINSVPVVYRATVTHFSTYNLDSAIQSPIPFTVTVKNGNSLVAGASIVAKTSQPPAWEGHGITGADGKFRFDSVPTGTNSVIATFGNLKGVVYAYDIVGGEGYATITLETYKTKVIKFFYMDGATKKNAIGANFTIEWIGGGQLQSMYSGLTDANGQVSTLLSDTASSYYIITNLTVGADQYSIAVNYTKFSDIPDEIELIKQ